jgi:hypothetical protein
MMEINIETLADAVVAEIERRAGRKVAEVA